MTDVNTNPQTEGPDDLTQVMTPDEPLGPEVSEELMAHTDLFLALYKSKQDLNSQLRNNMPAYVIGRKGAGKTAFLMGEGFASGNYVVTIKAANAFTVVDELRIRWESERGNLSADHIAYIWQSILLHCAMRATVALERPENRHLIAPIVMYLANIQGFDSPNNLHGDLNDREDAFLAEVGRRLLTAMGDGYADFTPLQISLLKARGGSADFQSALDALLRLASIPGERRLCLVIDNLEDLQTRVSDLEPVLAGLFRITSRVSDPSEPMLLPFDLRFAFPAELVRKLRRITANPEKDFRNHITIEWTAAELYELVSMRLRKSLVAHFGGDRVTAFCGDEARETLRSVLPATDMTNGLGGPEDALAYIMRHTQLLPRHLILIMNTVLSPMIKSGSLRRVTRDEVIRGVAHAENVIVEGILSSHLHDYPKLGEIIERLHNAVSLTITQEDLREAYARSGARAETDQRYGDFVWAGMAAGILGLERERTKRYVIADFSYTYPSPLHPLPDDNFCLHPLFVRRLHDGRSLERMMKDGVLPVYPHGSGSNDPWGDEDFQ